MGVTIRRIYNEDAVSFDYYEHVAAYTGPVLILHGDKDDMVPLEDSRKMSKRYADCELAVLTGETHHFDRHPDRMQQVIRNWLSSRVSLAGK